MNYSKILSFKNVDHFSFLDPFDYNTYVFLNPENKPTLEQINVWNLEYKKSECKNTAKQKISACDWSVLEDVNLSNKQAFIDYRSYLRNLILNPVEDPIWQPEPDPIWN
jgi:hypothetical protein